jgi:predicted nucleotidyltransferase component of viral defense system
MNKGASVKARLLNIAKKENIAFQVIVFRYLHERFLHRLSVSTYKKSFFLKGGALLYVFENALTRPTKDVDLLGQNVPNDVDEIKSIFQEIAQVKHDDSVWFDANTIDTEIIREEEKYEGVRVHIEAGFHTVKNRIQIDIGFGDIISPRAQAVYYPTLLPEFDPIELQAYSLESIIAEKLHAMVVLAYANSRMKDFYDLYVLLQSEQLSTNSLSQAIKATFERRQTKIPDQVLLFKPDFRIDENFNLLWEQFLRKNKLSIDVAFKDVVAIITTRFEPILNLLK